MNDRMTLTIERSGERSHTHLVYCRPEPDFGQPPEEVGEDDRRGGVCRGIIGLKHGSGCNGLDVF